MHRNWSLWRYRVDGSASGLQCEPPLRNFDHDSVRSALGPIVLIEFLPQFAKLDACGGIGLRVVRLGLSEQVDTNGILFQIRRRAIQQMIPKEAQQPLECGPVAEDLARQHTLDLCTHGLQRDAFHAINCMPFLPFRSRERPFVRSLSRPSRFRADLRGAKCPAGPRQRVVAPLYASPFYVLRHFPKGVAINTGC